MVDTLRTTASEILIATQKLLAKQLVNFFCLFAKEFPTGYKKEAKASEIKKQIENCLLDICSKMHADKIMSLVYVRKKFNCLYTNNLKLPDVHEQR